MLLLTVVSFKGYALDDTGEEVKLYMGEVKFVLASNPNRVAIGNPAIADVASVSRTEVAITPKSVGNTTLVIWDNFGEQSYTIRVFAENTTETKRRVDALIEKLNLPEVYTKADDDEAKVIILGKVKNKESKERIATILGKLKDKTVDLTSLKEEETVIEIDTQILELQKGVEQNLGFQWPTSLSLTESTSSSVTRAWGSLFRVSPITNTTPFTMTLNTLIQENKVRVLSRPRVSCLSGKEAKLLVGGEVPVLSGTVTPGAGTSGGVAATPGNVEYKEYGITLNIKPRVDELGRIRLGLDLTVSELGQQISTAYALAYTFTKRNATTELYLDDGETVAIGGLIKHKTEEDLRKFPWLSEIPVLGAFFRNKHTLEGGGLSSNSDTDLFITLTPHIVRQEMKPEDKDRTIRNVTPVVSSEETMDPVTKYARIIQQRILENLTYPQNARQAGFQGTTRLRLKLSYQGELLDAEVKSSSGYKVLDDNAVNTAKMSPSYPPFPPTIKDKEIWVEIPVIYQLE
jgi:pilus assembly protein CpaC